MIPKLKTGLVLACVFGLSACQPAEQSDPNTFAVSSTCEGAPQCYASVQAAIDAASEVPGTDWVTIRVAPGNYYEKIALSRDHTNLIGTDAQTTRIYFDAVARDSGKYHRNNWGTPGSATLTINAKDISVSGLTFENTYDYLTDDRLPDDSPDKNPHPQAAALLLDIESDRVHMDGVSLVAYQDTLFANGGRCFFENGFISGNVDFIFGNGMLLIEDSTIESRLRGKVFPEGEVQSFITAPSTPLSQPFGIVVYNSRLTREAGLPDQSVTLGRPWHPTTTFPDGRYADPDAVGYTTFIDTWMDGHIHADRWSTMNGTARDGSKTDVFRPEDSRFNETGSTGPGARPSDMEITWQTPMTIEEVRALIFTDWALSPA